MLKQGVVQNTTRSAGSIRRIKKELDALQKAKLDGVELWFDSQLSSPTIHGDLIGPQETCFEGGLFAFEMTFPEEYPFRPPKFHMLTEILHPGIRGGSICCDILSSQWSPALTVKQVIMAVLGLLKDPNFDDYINEDAVEMYRRGEFEMRAEEATLTSSH